MSALFLLCIFFVIPNAVIGENGGYPPMWDLIPDDLSNGNGEDGTVIIDPWNYQQRMWMYKALLNITAPFLDMKEPDNKRNVLWGLALQFGWQFHTGRLKVETEDSSCDSATEEKTCVSVRSWWACMNYYLAVVPFLGAVDAGFFQTSDIQILPPKETQSDFCYSIAGCRSSAIEAINGWKTFFEKVKKSSQTSDGSAPLVAKDENYFLTHMWKAHVESIDAGLPKCSKRLNYLSQPEGNFGKDWATAVGFIAATNFPTSFQSTNDFQAFLPHRKLKEGDNAPYIKDFTEQENRVLSALQKISKANTLSGGLLLKIWVKAMCSDAARAEGRNLLNNMIHDPNLAVGTVFRIIMAMVTHPTCKVEKRSA